MYLEGSAVATASLDPSLLAILGVFGGAALTAVAGSIGASRQARREHDKWVRNERMGAFADAMAIHERVANLTKRAREAQRLAEAPTDATSEVMALHAQNVAETAALAADLPAAMARLMILGPRAVHEAAEQHIGAIRSGDSVAERKSYGKTLSAMRKALDVDYVTKRSRWFFRRRRNSRNLTA